jgi:hypothetical protein
MLDKRSCEKEMERLNDNALPLRVIHTHAKVTLLTSTRSYLDRIRPRRRVIRSCYPDPATKNNNNIQKAARSSNHDASLGLPFSTTVASYPERRSATSKGDPGIDLEAH